jgi:K+-transporting ATPase KdpF subunit
MVEGPEYASENANERASGTPELPSRLKPQWRRSPAQGFQVNTTGASALSPARTARKTPARPRPTPVKAVVTLGLLIYLTVALLRRERF